ncbi:TQO small subunit DoxD [Psychroflexus planctonicus]|uniref:Quinol oxidase n=1 Tax=Psychroflexus planctonicus TaxID=1526575 RepID=A0ABQ1SEU1_9FLAO|nr:TQO small subunit DoxD [Psychroflexus planctonicus]GGE28279.1 quinol oxidase [Psychroflexus planctonicus]
MNSDINKQNSSYSLAGLFTLSLRLVAGWTYFSALWRRVVLTNKLDPELPGYIGEKFNHFLPNALGIGPLIEYMLENPDVLYFNMVSFTIIEGVVGLFFMFGFFTRLSSIGVIGLALGILLGAGWIGTTCLDEWQIGVLGIAAGFTIFFSGGGHFSLDHYLANKKGWFSSKKAAFLTSGTLPFTDAKLKQISIVGAIGILGLTLFTNQVFHGGLWGDLHNKSVSPKLEISNVILKNQKLSFQVYRVEGVDVYGSFLIKMEVLNQRKEAIFSLDADDLANFNSSKIENKYIAKVKPGKHALIIPLGAKANLNLELSPIQKEKAKFLKLTDVSGKSWIAKVQ